MRQNQDRLIDIIESIDAIVSKTHQGRGAFDDDPMLRVWCLHHITIIGEATSRLSPELRTKHPSSPWRDIIAMRNAVVHGYFDVDWNEVWNVVERDLPLLRKNIEEILILEGWKS